MTFHLQSSMCALRFCFPCVGSYSSNKVNSSLRYNCFRLTLVDNIVLNPQDLLPNCHWLFWDLLQHTEYSSIDPF